MRQTILAALAAAILILPACTKNESQSTASDTGSTASTSDTSATTVTSPAGEASPPPPSNVALADREFADKAARMGMAEVQLANNVGSRGASADVRAFAQKMIEDHNRSNQELTTLAAQKHLDPPADLDPDHKALDAELAKLSGAELDRKYMEAMVKDHTIAMTDFENASKGLTDPDLKAFAAKTLPTLQQHHQLAQQVTAKLK